MFYVTVNAFLIAFMLLNDSVELKLCVCVCFHRTPTVHKEA